MSATKQQLQIDRQKQSTDSSESKIQKRSQQSETGQQIEVGSLPEAASERLLPETGKVNTALRTEPHSNRVNNQITEDCGYGLEHPLFKAIENNDLAKVRELISAGANVNLVTRVYGGCFFPLVYTPLILAVEGNRFEIFKALLAVEGVDVNETDHFGSGVLHEASKVVFGTKMVELLLKRRDVDINLKNTKFGYTPLHDAVMNHCTETVRLLLEREDIDVNVKDKDDGFTPLHHAAIEDQAAIVKLLLQKKNIDVNVRDNDSGSTPLALASKFGFVKVVEALLEADCIDANAANSLDRSTALHEASKNGHEEVVKRLLGNEGVSVNVRNISGLTALMEASNAGHSQICDSILAKRAEDSSSSTFSELLELMTYWLSRTRRLLSV